MKIFLKVYISMMGWNTYYHTYFDGMKHLLCMKTYGFLLWNLETPSKTPIFCYVSECENHGIRLAASPVSSTTSIPHPYLKYLNSPKPWFEICLGVEICFYYVYGPKNAETTSTMLSPRVILEKNEFCQASEVHIGNHIVSSVTHGSQPLGWRSSTWRNSADGSPWTTRRTAKVLAQHGWRSWQQHFGISNGIYNQNEDVQVTTYMYVYIYIW
jgi:hypothetical protein